MSQWRGDGGGGGLCLFRPVCRVSHVSSARMSYAEPSGPRVLDLTVAVTCHSVKRGPLKVTVCVYI